MVRPGALALLFAAGLAAAGVRVAAQAPSDIAQMAAQATPGQPAVLRYHNRPIAVLRATIFSRPPVERAAGAVRILDDLVDSRGPATVATRIVQGVAFVSVGGRDVFAILPLDVDGLAGETIEGRAAETRAQLQQALDEARELRTPRLMLMSALQALAGTAVAALLLWLAFRLYRVLAVSLPSSAERRLERLSSGSVQLVRASRAPEVLRYLVTTAFMLGVVFVGFSWLTFVLRRFPYTRPWGESLRAFLFDRLAALGLQMVNAAPDLFTVVVILLITRFVVRLSNAVFRSAEEGRVAIPYVYAETAAPTRRLVATLFWLLGIVVAYPYLPGSGSDAFKGVSVFVGLVVSLGSSGIVNQMMSGLTITYSRALHIGDFVRIGEVEGTVTHLGSLSTKIKTPRGEEVTIPNAVVMSQVTTNYSPTEGVYVPTSLTIGYDTPWRQVQALLLLAAERTPGIRRQPKPVVRQSGLHDFYVEYTLMVCLEQAHLRGPTLGALHANILDAFNEYGVQITSPNYEADPGERKVVPRERWYSAPADVLQATDGRVTGEARKGDPVHLTGE